MDEQSGARRVLQMRLVVEAPDYDEAVAFYRDVLGARQEEAIEGGDGAKTDATRQRRIAKSVGILKEGRAR